MPRQQQMNFEFEFCYESYRPEYPLQTVQKPKKKMHKSLQNTNRAADSWTERQPYSHASGKHNKITEI